MQQDIPIAQSHSWDLTPSEAVKLQKELRKKIRLQDHPSKITLIGGADISYNKFSKVVYAGIVVLNLSDLTEVSRSVVVSETSFPYIPGLLSFRELPPLLKAWEELPVKPDVMMLDGHGIAHPRRFGIACHFGLVTGVPAFGCGKSLLTGKHGEPGENPGESCSLDDKDEKIGLVVRTKKKTRPIYASPGHLVSFEDCLSLVMQSVTRYRIPEPTRQAHLMVNQVRVAHRN